MKTHMTSPVIAPAPLVIVQPPVIVGAERGRVIVSGGGGVGGVVGGVVRGAGSQGPQVLRVVPRVSVALPRSVAILKQCSE